MLLKVKLMFLARGRTPSASSYRRRDLLFGDETFAGERDRRVLRYSGLRSDLALQDTKRWAPLRVLHMSWILVPRHAGDGGGV